ncbi:MAG TPA: GerMN domain-containing protein [Terracidiphilus sp.]|nr:GerMN domain-containing protein [Terracidiphilus sp.]
MIPRYQKVLFVILLIAALGMGFKLWQLRDRAHKRLLTGQTIAPTAAPVVAPAEQATLVVANDLDNSLMPQMHSLPLPADRGARARAILGKLLDLYAAPESTHEIPGGAASVDQVFLVPAQRAKDPGDELAVVNLTGTFAASHPAGLETESLTVLSICATLRANFPNIKEVRFLVDGVDRPTLAGHADLTRTYLTSDAAPMEGTRP